MIKSIGSGVGVLAVALIITAILIGIGLGSIYFFGLKGVIAWPFILLILINAGYFYFRGRNKT